jgi:hypothetical protein
VRERVEDKLREEEAKSPSETPSGSGRNSPVVGGSSDRKTDAEKRFEAIQRQRVSMVHMGAALPSHHKLRWHIVLRSWLARRTRIVSTNSTRNLKR